MINKIFHFIIILCLLISISCRKDNPETSSNTHSWNITILTSPIKNLSQTTAECGGLVLYNNDKNIAEEVGICWDTIENFIISNNKILIKLSSPSFTCQLKNLTPETKYFVRTFIKNKGNYFYGNTVTFTTYKLNAIIDIDSNFYNVVKIKSQVWMQENLRVTHYNDGQLIPNITDANSWANTTTGALCYNNNDSTKNIQLLGLLYNWYAVNTNKLCPEGWHIPSENDFTILLNNLGNSDSEIISNLKMTGKEYWEDYSSATNSSNFSSIPTICRYKDGTFNPFKNDETEYWIKDNSRYFYLDDDYKDIKFNNTSSNPGISVRCLKN